MTTLKQSKEVIEVKEKIRDWWYKQQDAGYDMPESGRVELEHIVYSSLDRIAKEKDEEWRKILNSGKKMYEIGKRDGARETLDAMQETSLAYKPPRNI